MTASVEIAGKQFGNLLVLERAGSTSYGQSKWRCKCVCGNEGVFPWSSLKRGHVQSCGCLWRRTFEETRICAACKIEKPRSDFPQGNSGHGLGAYCRPCHSQKSLERYRANPKPALERLKRRREELRAKVIAAYGGKCACCGEAQPIFLAIDHKNNDGGQHRKQVGRGDQFYKWVCDNGFPSDLQLLCANCNWGKHVNGGVCPHAIVG